jgi:hypothetical protein
MNDPRFLPCLYTPSYSVYHLLITYTIFAKAGRLETPFVEPNVIYKSKPSTRKVSAWVLIKLRRGATASPMRILKV